MKTITPYILLIPLMILASLLLQTKPLSAQPADQRPLGLTIYDQERASEGYVLVTLIQSPQILLLSKDGRVVHIWESEYYPRNAAYLLENGHLVRPTYTPEIQYGGRGRAGFASGLIEELSWDGEVRWSFKVADERIVAHHDIVVLPSGNVLVVAFERFSAEEAIAAGRNPGLIPESGELWSEKIIEIDPQSGQIVWEWRAWDHLIQDHTPDAPNFGSVYDHSRRIDLNYLDAGAALEPNFLHINGISYNPARGEILVSVRKYSEFWIIDHKTTTQEARGEAGDLLYRWGNPEAYRAGGFADRHLLYPHNAAWIPEGMPGAGNVLIFNNGGPQRNYSNIIEMTPSFDENGRYIMPFPRITGSDAYVWEYTAAPPESFSSPIISSAQRQLNGNTLIAEGVKGRIFEVTPEGDTVWEYYLPLPLWIFRAESYQWPIFESFDLTHNLPIAAGELWQVQCADGSKHQLYTWAAFEAQQIAARLQQHGENARSEWEKEMCVE